MKGKEFNVANTLLTLCAVLVFAAPSRESRPSKISGGGKTFKTQCERFSFLRWFGGNNVTVHLSLLLSDLIQEFTYSSCGKSISTFSLGTVVQYCQLLSSGAGIYAVKSKRNRLFIDLILFVFFLIQFHHGSV